MDPSTTRARRVAGLGLSMATALVKGFELSRGRGGARCMSGPFERDAA
jgi:arginine deiminase